MTVVDENLVATEIRFVHAKSMKFSGNEKRSITVEHLTIPHEIAEILYTDWTAGIGRVMIDGYN